MFRQRLVQQTTILVWFLATLLQAEELVPSRTAECELSGLYTRFVTNQKTIFSEMFQKTLNLQIFTCSLACRAVQTGERLFGHRKRLRGGKPTLKAQKGAAHLPAGSSGNPAQIPASVWSSCSGGLLSV